MDAEGKELTAWGKWVREQPRGTLSRAMWATGYAWVSVSRAQYHLVSTDLAEALSRFTDGAVKASEMRSRPSAAARARRKKRVA